MSPTLTSSSLIGFVSGSDDRVTIALEELQDLKGVWSELGKIWEKIEELREKPWLSVAPRKIRQALDALLQQLRGFPSRLKTYASFDYVQTLLKGYTKVRGKWRNFSRIYIHYLCDQCFVLFMPMYMYDDDHTQMIFMCVSWLSRGNSGI